MGNTHRLISFLCYFLVVSETLQLLTDAGAPLPSGAALADLLQRHETKRKLVDYRLFMTGSKYTHKKWRLRSTDEYQTTKRGKLQSLPRRPAPLFICRRKPPLPGVRQSRRTGSAAVQWEPPYVELRLSDIRPISVERRGHVCSDDRAWYINRYGHFCIRVYVI